MILVCLLWLGSRQIGHDRLGSAFLAKEIEGSISGDPPDPGPELLTLAEFGDPLVPSEEGFLGRILRRMRAAKHAQTDPEHAPVVSADKPLVRGLVTVSAAGHQPFVASQVQGKLLKSASTILTNDGRPKCRKIGDSGPRSDPAGMVAVQTSSLHMCS